MLRRFSLLKLGYSAKSSFESDDWRLEVDKLVLMGRRFRHGLFSSQRFWLGRFITTKVDATSQARSISAARRRRQMLRHRR